MVDDPYSIGIDLGGTFTKLAAVSAGGVVLAESRIATVAGQPPGAALGGLRDAAEAMARGAGLAFPPPLDCGIGVPAVVDYRTGHVTLSGLWAGATCRSAAWPGRPSAAR